MPETATSSQQKPSSAKDGVRSSLIGFVARAGTTIKMTALILYVVLGLVSLITILTGIVLLFTNGLNWTSFWAIALGYLGATIYLAIADAPSSSTNTLAQPQLEQWQRHDQIVLREQMLRQGDFDPNRNRREDARKRVYEHERDVDPY